MNIEQIANVQELREQNARLKRQLELRRNNGILFYRPHWKQHKFHSAGGKIGRYLRTGNRFGKSDCGAAETVAWLLGGRVWYREAFDILDGSRSVVARHEGGYDHPLVRAGIPDRPVKGLLLVVDWDKAKEIFTNRDGSYENWGKLFKLFPKSCNAKPHLSRGGHIDQITIERPTEFGGGSSTLYIDTIQSWKHEKLSGESSDWDFIHVDEPCPEKMFKGHARGLMDRNGSYWFTCTPLDQMWINDQFTPPGRYTIVDDADGYSFGTKFVICGSTYDNPYRTDAGVAEFESTLTAEERACRLHGLPLAMAGLVYKEFVYDMHVLCDVPKGWEDYHNPPKNYTIRVAWDVHQRLPQALLFAATAPDGTVFIYDELFFDSLLEPNVAMLKQRLVGRHVTDYHIDPFAVIPNPVDGSSVLTELWKYDLPFMKASKDLTLGINKVREKLAERGIVSKLPTIYFAPHLKETLYEFTHYVYNLDKQKPQDGDDHMMENLYRLVLNGLEYVAPPSKDDFRQLPPLTISHAEDLFEYEKISYND